MNKKTDEMLQYLKLQYLAENWDEILKNGERNNLSYQKFLNDILIHEFELRQSKAMINRIKMAKIPNEFSIETYPFDQQPHLNKKRLWERHDSMDYIEKNKNIIFLGPAGTGKTGLASSLLRSAVSKGHSGRFVEFRSLMDELLQSLADRSEKKIIHRYAKYECLLIDDLSFVEADKAEAGLFYSLIQKRYKKTCTIVTSTLSFSEWDKIFNNKQLTDGLVSRLTDNGHILNLKDCESVRAVSDVD